MTSKGMDFTGKPPKNVNTPPGQLLQGKNAGKQPLLRIPGGQFEYYFLKLSNICSGSAEEPGKQHEKAHGKARKNQHRIFILRGFCVREIA